MADLIYTDTGGTLRALWGEDTARINPLTEGIHAAAQIPWTQASAAARPKVARMPVTGVRNLANGSASPSGYNDGGTGGGLTFTTVGSGVEDGKNYVDIRAFGTSSSTNTTALYLGTQSETDVVPGQTFTGSVTLRRIGGSDANVDGLRIAVREIGGSLPSPLASATTSETDVVQSETLTTTTSNTISAVLQLIMTSGAAIDVTYRVKGFQFEEGSTPSAYQANFSVFDITEAGVASIACVEVDGLVDQMQMVIPNGITDGRVAYCSPEQGIWIEEGVTVAPGGTLNWGAEDGAGGTVGLINALGRRFWAVIPLDGTRSSDVGILNAEAQKLGLPGVITTLPS